MENKRPQQKNPASPAQKPQSQEQFGKKPQHPNDKTAPNNAQQKKPSSNW